MKSLFKTALQPLIALLGLPLLALTGCNSDDSKDSKLSPAEPIILSEAESRAAESVNDFGLEFFAKKSAECDGVNKNLTVSPLSVSMLAAVVANACDEAEGAKVAEALGCNDLAALNSYSAKLVAKLSTIDPASTFYSANSLWYRNDMHVRDAFATPAREYYDMELFGRDFKNSASVSNEISKWISSKTKGLIDDCKPSITPTSTIAVLNAIYFKGIWTEPFDTKSTSEARFNGTAGPATVDMMHNSSKYGYAQTESGEAVTLEFGNGAFEAVLVLPANGKALTAGELSEILDSGFSEASEVNLSFPKFEYRERNLDVSSILAGTGIDLNNISILEEQTSSDCEAMQDSYIRFNEEGAEMAAVTYLGDTVAAPGNVIDMDFDRPFYFFLRERSTETILLAGRINNL